MNRKLTALLLAACVSMTATATTFAAGGSMQQGAMQQQQQGMNNTRTQQNNIGRNNNGQGMTPANATPDPNATPTPTPDPNAQFGMNGGRGGFGQNREGTEETDTEKPSIEPIPDIEEGATPNPEERPDKRGDFDPESTPPADIDGATPEPREFDENRPDMRGDFDPENNPENKPEDAPENIPENDRDNRPNDMQQPQDNAAPNDDGKINGVKEMAFKDVPSDAWYYENVKKAYKYGFISGDSDDVFNPEKALSGAELLTMLYKADGNTYTAPASGEWYEPVTKWAKELKLIDDDDEWEFKPDDELSREQMMVILYRYLENKGVDLGDGKDLSEFYDASDISDYAREAVSRLVGAGYISGSDNKISPRDSLTKAEAVTVIVRTLVNLLK